MDGMAYDMPRLFRASTGSKIWRHLVYRLVFKQTFDGEGEGETEHTARLSVCMHVSLSD